MSVNNKKGEAPEPKPRAPGERQAAPPRIRGRVLEQSILFVSIVKWLFFAACVGVIVGLSTTVFLKALETSITLMSSFRYYFVLLPAAFFVSSLIVLRFAPEAKGHGTEKVIEAVHKNWGRIDPWAVPVKLVATIITIALGGSAGKEGPCAQIGAGLCSMFAGWFKFDDVDRRKLVVCGISAGFAAVFGTPIAGAMFGVEVLFIGSLLYDVLLPSFVAGIVGYQVSSHLGITYFHETLRFVPDFSGPFFIKVCASGLFFGICSFFFIEMLRYIERLSGRVRLWEPARAVLGGACLALLAFALSPRYLGLGLHTIQQALEGTHVPVFSFVAKMLFTSVTLSFGGSGGIVTPIFFIGATAGNVFAWVLGYDLAVFSAIGMVSLLAGAANTPISASIMAVELFGPAVAPYAAIACVISFLMTGHRSVYPSQVLAASKSRSLIVSKGREIHVCDVSFEPRDKSVAGGIIKEFGKLRRKRHRDDVE